MDETQSAATIASFLKKLYWICATILLAAIAFNAVMTEAVARGLYGFVATAAVLYFSYYVVFLRRQTRGLIDIFKPVLFFNLIIVVLFYYARYDFGFPSNEFRIGFTYGNFWDFYFHSLTVAEGTFEAINTGYFPFAYAIGKLFTFLSGWKLGYHVIRPGTVVIYTIYLTIFLSPLILLGREVIVSQRLSKDEIFFLWLFLAICYPVLFIVERGNYALVSFFFLALMLYSYHCGKYNWCAVCAGLLVSLKVVNLLFVIFVVRYCWKQLGIFLGTILSATICSLIYLFGFNVSKWSMFKYALVAPFGHMLRNVVQQYFITTDGGKLQGGVAGIEGFRVLLHTLFYSVKTNLVSDIGWWNLVLLAMGLLSVIYFYLVCRKSADWLDEIMVLTVVPLLFHSASADYNLLLLMPAFMLVAARASSVYNNALLRFSNLFLILSGGVVIWLVRVDVSEVFNSATPRSLLVPFSLLGILLTVFTKKHFLALEQGTVPQGRLAESKHGNAS